MRPRFEFWRARGRRGLRWGVRACAVLFVLQLLAAHPAVCGRAVAWFRYDTAAITEAPDFIVVMGGGGIPSGSGLMRTYHAAELAHAYPRATIVIAMPVDGALEGSTAAAMRDELALRGVVTDRVVWERRGRNTAEQARGVRALLGDDALSMRFLIVSSDLHIRRAILAFRRQGFETVGGSPAKSQSIDAHLGRGTFWRYGIWTNLSLEWQLAREAVALLQYRLRGDI